MILTDTYGLTVTVAPEAEPLDFEATKRYLRVDADDETQNDVIADLIAEMRDRFERVCDRACITQTLALTMAGWPCGGVIRLPRSPLQSVTSIGYVDANGDTQTLDAANYLVDATTEPGRVTVAVYGYPPTTQYRTAALTVTYVAGYGEDYTDVPAEVRGRLRTAVAYAWENREQRDEDYIDRLFLSLAVRCEG